MTYFRFLVPTFHSWDGYLIMQFWYHIINALTPFGSPFVDTTLSYRLSSVTHWKAPGIEHINYYILHGQGLWNVGKMGIYTGSHWSQQRLPNYLNSMEKRMAVLSSGTQSCTGPHSTSINSWIQPPLWTPLCPWRILFVFRILRPRNPHLAQEASSIPKPGHCPLLSTMCYYRVNAHFSGEKVLLHQSTVPCRTRSASNKWGHFSVDIHQNHIGRE